MSLLLLLNKLFINESPFISLKGLVFILLLLFENKLGVKRLLLVSAENNGLLLILPANKDFPLPPENNEFPLPPENNDFPSPPENNDFPLLFENKGKLFENMEVLLLVFDSLLFIIFILPNNEFDCCASALFFSFSLLIFPKKFNFGFYFICFCIKVNHRFNFISKHWIYN